MKLGQIQGNGKCWFCGETCEKLWYWHKECKEKWVEENK